MMERSVLMLTVICSCTVIDVCVGRPRNMITTLLDAKWYQAPIVLEISEFLADEDNTMFWTFLDSINQLNPSFSELKTDKDKYDAGLFEASKLLSPTRMNLLKLSLSLHLYSPRIEMYTQMASQRNLTCVPMVDICGIKVCTLSKLNDVIQELRLRTDDCKSDVFKIDHQYPRSENRSMVVILYAEIGTDEFNIYHNALKKYSHDGQIRYIFRHYVKTLSKKFVRLSGYGVELQMKSTEYKAQDDTKVDKNDDKEEESGQVIEGFNFKKLREVYPDKIDELEKFRLYLLETTEDIIPLKAWEFQELNLQASQLIANTAPENVINVFTTISQNFPMQTRSLVDIKVTEELKKEIHENQDQYLMMLNIQPSDTGLFINGLYFDVELTDIMTILESIRTELRIMEGIYGIGLKEKEVVRALLSLDLTEATKQTFAVDIRDSAVMWVNDLENDKKYKRWSPNIMELLKPTFPGMLRSIRRNVFNLVIICDPAHRNSWSLMKMAESFIVYSAPIRVGLIFSTPPIPVSGFESASVALLNAFNYVSEEKDRYEALSFITEVYATIKSDRDVEVQDVKKRLVEKYYGVDVDDVFGSDSDYNTGRKLAADFIFKSGIVSLPQALVNGVPLAEKLLTKEDFEDALLHEVMLQTPAIQKAVYKRELYDSDDIVEFLMNKPNVMPRLNRRILNKEYSRYINLKRDESFLLNIKYLTNTKPNQIATLAYWIIGDFNTDAARKLLYSALEYMETSRTSRISIIINPKETDMVDGKRDINKFLLSALNNGDEKQFSKILKGAISILDGEKSFQDYNLSELPDMDDLIANHKEYVKNVIQLNSGESAIVVNGRILGPLDLNEDFITADFLLLDKHCSLSYVNKIYESVKSDLAKISDEQKENVFMQLVALLTSNEQTKSRTQFPKLSDKHSVVKLPARMENEPVFDISVVVDPVSRGAQKVGSILSVLYEILNAEIKIHLNPMERLSDIPLKSYYRFVLEPELRFTKTGDLTSGPIANFTGVSSNSLLTQFMHVPENWLVESVVTPYDLDNIRLSDVGGYVYSQFELEYLLLEGHCFDTMYGSPPRGLQITLGTETNPLIMDTIVMANLGYFQLKANPGVSVLRLRQGRSSDIYDIVSYDGVDVSPNSTDIKILLGSFQSQVIKLKVSKKPDKIHEQLLDDSDDAPSGIWNSITSTFSGSKPDGHEDETINIFSVASGHLYERFLNIMILSVVKHTKSPVKFWFLKNYLSPTFKDFLPRMAERYNFSYELVQYKWPRWLHQQTEKQRIIWGYKILFLDVLFPLDVKKIIFVDADLVVRADLKDLVNLDLQGAPYGYTPFCSSRKEMDGFRFWQQGYWRSHLQGRTYHISALYVVDLKRFRKIAAGDRLRGQYQALSQDPNSLSNLDQDLPNNMIHQVAIKSLPQEWLWCETWCDEESKAKAKTIDLCNNPLTKEAKLTAAMRIISEWKNYDDEIKRLQLRLDDEEIEEFPEENSSSDVHAHTEL